MKDDVETSFVVKLGQKALGAVVLISKATGITETKTMMNALGFYMWAYNEWKAGNRIGSITSKGGVDEVQFIKLEFMEKNENSNSGQQEIPPPGSGKKLLN